MSNYVRAYVRAANFKATEFMQYLFPPGGGPSSNTCPRCPPHRLQLTSVRPIPKLLSAASRTFSFASGSVKLGHPVPELNFVRESKSAVPQQTHRYNPSPWKFQYSPAYASSVSPRRV